MAHAVAMPYLNRFAILTSVPAAPRHSPQRGGAPPVKRHKKYKKKRPAPKAAASESVLAGLDSVDLEVPPLQPEPDPTVRPPTSVAEWVASIVPESATTVEALEVEAFTETTPVLEQNKFETPPQTPTVRLKPRNFKTPQSARPVKVDNKHSLIGWRPAVATVRQRSLSLPGLKEHIPLISSGAEPLMYSLAVGEAIDNIGKVVRSPSPPLKPQRARPAFLDRPLRQSTKIAQPIARAPAIITTASSPETSPTAHRRRPPPLQIATTKPIQSPSRSFRPQWEDWTPGFQYDWSAYHGQVLISPATTEEAITPSSAVYTPQSAAYFDQWSSQALAHGFEDAWSARYARHEQEPRYSAPPIFRRAHSSQDAQPAHRSAPTGTRGGSSYNGQRNGGYQGQRGAFTGQRFRGDRGRGGAGRPRQGQA